MRKLKGLREIPWGIPESDQTCIYDNGHIDAAEFLQRVRDWNASDVHSEYRSALTLADVEYLRFRPMSPSEARQYGVDSGIIRTLEGGYPVTAVML